MTVAILLAAGTHAWAQQTGGMGGAGSAGTLTRLSVAAAPNTAGGNGGNGAGAGAGAGGGGVTGGIRYVTRPGSRVTPILAGASFFGAGGVPVLPATAPTALGAGTGAGALVVAGAPRPPTPPGDRTAQTLATMAAGGDRKARQALAILSRSGASSAGPPVGKTSR